MIELVLSLGVLSFAFVSLLALLPAGMSTVRKAIDASVTTQISQRIVNEAQQTDFATYIAKQPAVRYFDDQGDELPGQTHSIYQVNVRVTTAPTLPGAPSANENLATVTVQIANNPGNKPLAEDSDNLWATTSGVPMVAYSTVIAGNNIAAIP